jgi:hypothetical protein
MIENTENAAFLAEPVTVEAKGFDHLPRRVRPCIQVSDLSPCKRFPQNPILYQPAKTDARA